MSTQPLALRLADRLSGHGGLTFVEMHAAAAELRRLHFKCEEMTALAEPVQDVKGCDHCNQPLYAATRCRVCGRVTPGGLDEA